MQSPQKDKRKAYTIKKKNRRANPSGSENNGGLKAVYKA